MQSNKYFGEYYPVESSIHKLSVFSKLITLLLMLIPIIASKSIELHLVMLFFILILIYSSKVPLRFYFDIIYGLRYIFVIFVVVLAFKGLELEDAVLYLTKIFNVITYLSLIFYTTSRSEIKYGIEKILTPFNIFNLNISGFINTLVNTISFFPLLLITNHEVLVNSSSRGLDYFYADIISKILAVLHSFKSTLRLTNNKLKLLKIKESYRLYSTKTYRTNYNTNKFGFMDVLLIGVYLIFIYYYKGLFKMCQNM